MHGGGIPVGGSIVVTLRTTRSAEPADNGELLARRRVCLRLAGNQSGVAAACLALADQGLRQRQSGTPLWQQLRDHQHLFFSAIRVRGSAPKAVAGSDAAGIADA